MTRTTPPPHRATVGEVMTSPVITVTAEASYKQLVAVMAEHDVSALPVVDAGGRMIGIVSEADLLRRTEVPGSRVERLLSSFGSGVPPDEAPTARDLMTTEVVTATRDMPVARAARLMRQRDVKRLPVVDGGTLVGMVSRVDLLRPFLRGDGEIRRDIADGVLLGWLWIDPSPVSIDVTDGAVTLRGRIERRSDVQLIERLAHSIDGVVSVDNRLEYGFDDLRARRRPVEARIR